MIILIKFNQSYCALRNIKNITDETNTDSINHIARGHKYFLRLNIIQEKLSWRLSASVTKREILYVIFSYKYNSYLKACDSKKKKKMKVYSIKKN